MSNPEHLRLAAVNIDGVMLTDTFSPVIHGFITSRGGQYTADVERSIFSQRRVDAGRAMAAAVPEQLTGEEALAQYFRERDRYLREQPARLNEGAVELVRRLRTAGLSVVCYGGLGEEHFQQSLGGYADLFDAPRYICTNDFRPGLVEIAAAFELPLGQVLFVDDVARVAEAARGLGAPFIGHPSAFPHSFQSQLMREAGVRHLVRSLTEVDDALLLQIDAEAAAGTLWSAAESRSAL